MVAPSGGQDEARSAFFTFFIRRKYIVRVKKSPRRLPGWSL